MRFGAAQALRAPRPATLHLGEAEAIYALERYHQDWTFVVRVPANAQTGNADAFIA